MILCSPNPQSILKASLLAELTGLAPELREANKQPNLFAHVDEVDADSFEFAKLLGELSAKTELDYDWLKHYQGRRIALMIIFNLRNRSRDCIPVIFAALAEALRYGPGYCICGRGQASAMFRSRSREVGSEIHRMMGLIRFEETAEGDFVAHPKLFHQTADILLRKFQLRYPNRRLVFVFPSEALCCEQGRIRRIEMQDLTPALLNPTDNFAALWETYYRSQYIPARKNIRLASHFIPKKYWDWLPEGKILEQEAKK